METFFYLKNNFKITWIKDDIINYPNYVYLTAEAVWNRDDKKKCLAESFGYTVCYIWERDMNQMTDTELLDKIKNICNI